VHAMPVAQPRLVMKKCPIAVVAGVTTRDVPTPPRIPKTIRNCQYSGFCSQQRHDLGSAGYLISHTIANSHQHDTRDHQRASGKDQKPWPSSVENGSDEDAAQEGQEDVSAEYPSY
jgi:hypothetical protein